MYPISIKSKDLSNEIVKFTIKTVQTLASVVYTLNLQRDVKTPRYIKICKPGYC